MCNIPKTYDLHRGSQTHTSRPLATLAAVAKTTAVQKSPNPSRTSAFNTMTSLTTWLPIIVNLLGLKPVAVSPKMHEAQHGIPTSLADSWAHVCCRSPLPSSPSSSAALEPSCPRESESYVLDMGRHGPARFVMSFGRVAKNNSI